MPEASFDKDLNLPKGSDKYIKLTKKGDKLKFVIAATPHYETIHFLPNKDRILCARFNGDDPTIECRYCDLYSEELDEKGKDDKKQYAPVTNFSYPVLNLDTGKAQVFQFNAKSIHYGIKRYFTEGVDIFKGKWSVERTEETGNYYPLLYLGEAKLSKEEIAELEKAKSLKLSGKESDSVNSGSED